MKVALIYPTLRSMVAAFSRGFHAVGDRLARLARLSPKMFAAGLLAVSVVFWLLLGSLAWFTYDVTGTIPGLNELRGLGNMSQATVLYDRHDRPVFTIFKEQRIEVPLSKMSPNMIRAVLSIEDQRFFHHAGVDIWRIFGAAFANFRRGKVWQGASTITQQLARLSFPDKISLRDQSYTRKLKEAILAALIERTYPKEQILEFYLNKVYLGDGYHGVEAAARGFFNKSAMDLSVEDAAMIAGVIQSPSNYAPTINLDKAVARRAQVLQAMLDNKAIDRAGFERARATKVHLENGIQRDEGYGQYFKEQIRRELIDRFGWTRVGEGGLKVYTTIDPDMQQAAEQALEDTISKIEARKGYKHGTRAELIKQKRFEYLQGSLVAMDPQTGEVRVMVGGRNFKESRFNRATQARRQPGSAFKPFVYASAIESGISAGQMITDLDSPIDTPQGGWMPEDEHSSAGAMTMRTALRTSSNRAAVRMLNTVGLRQTVDYLNKLHMGQMPQVPSLALGAAEVTLQSLTAGFATFANRGEAPKPILIRRIDDESGNTLATEKPEMTRAFSENTAFIVANMLTDVINAGTAYRARANGFNLPAAGKTGTTNDYVDAWFVGFTPKLVAGVWIGFDQPRTIVSNGYGGELAVPVWAEFMKAATKGDKATWLQRPKDVTGVDICRMSGKRPVDGCSHVEVLTSSGEVQVRSMAYLEYFVRGTEPTETCDLHDTSNFFQRLAGAFKSGGELAPVPVDQAGLPQHSAAPAKVEEAKDRGEAAEDKKQEAEASAEEPKKKKGFWGRIFGSRKQKNSEQKPETRNPNP
jgi:1A family penicillin-binding protein